MRLESGVDGESELVSLGREDELVDKDEGLDMVGGVVVIVIRVVESDRILGYQSTHQYSPPQSTVLER
jgi:hypothetical protein